MNLYSPDECAVFFKTRERFGELSNMVSGFPIIWNGYRVYSSEALYQAQKFMPDTFEFMQVISQKNPFVSKTIAKQYTPLYRADWYGMRIDVMHSCLRLKLDQHPDIMNRVLDETIGMPIVERSRRDRFWGAVNDYKGNLEGENVLGQLWMIIRDARP